MIESAVREALGNVWGDIAYYVTFAFLDPVWGWAAWLVLLYFVVALLCYFFGSLWPPLRWIGGVMLIIATFGLFAFAKGESAARAHDAKTKPKPKQTTQVQQRGGWPPWS